MTDVSIIGICVCHVTARCIYNSDLCVRVSCDRCICGLLCNKTVLLVSHSPAFLATSDLVIVMDHVWAQPSSTSIYAICHTSKSWISWTWGLCGGKLDDNRCYMVWYSKRVHFMCCTLKASASHSMLKWGTYSTCDPNIRYTHTLMRRNFTLNSICINIIVWLTCVIIPPTNIVDDSCIHRAKYFTREPTKT